MSSLKLDIKPRQKPLSVVDYIEMENIRLKFNRISLLLMLR